MAVGDYVAPVRTRSGEDIIRGDTFGFRKVVLVVSSVGKLYALDSFDKGKILWTHYFGDEAGESYRLLDVRPRSESAPALCALVNMGAAGASLVPFDPITGATEAAMVIEKKV